MSRKKSQIVAGVVSIAVNIVLFAAKFWAGLLTGSIALMADAWHTLSDSITSVFMIFAAKLASKKPDKEHPFGHGRWELIASVLMAFVLGVIGLEFIMSSIERLQNRESVAYGTLALVITIVSIVVKELLAQYEFYLGRKYNNPVITADAWHSRTDSLSSVVILIGIIITKFAANLWWMDSVLGIVCALMIFYAAYEIMKEVVTKMLGEEPEQSFIDELTDEIKKIYDSDLMLHHIHLHNYVTHKELTLHIMLNKHMTIEEGHDVATVIEDRIQEHFDMTATIHVEPLQEQEV
ncbi:MAG: cation diffusion facilitator family transporter [Oscillospiraceae bacterium]|nr:cation diffusion facilitator family transporter [Oscillospiraceae bacterium]